MQTYFFSISVPYLQCEELYQSENNAVVLTADNGVRVQVPSANLRPFVGREGIKGRFRLVVTDNKKVKSFEKIG